MTKRGNEPKERKPLAPVPAGSGITEYTRPPTILDDVHRDRAFRGGLVDGRVSRTPAPSMQEFRSEVEQFCRDVFADAGLPDPFSFIHPAGKFTPLDGKDVIARGLDYIKSRFALGYQLEAMHYLLSMSPGEDHTELWYAARLAAEFTTLDLLVTRLRANDGAPEELLMYAAQTGAEIGRLDKERRLKFAHEPDAIRGEDFDPKRPRRKTGRSPNKHKKTRDENIVERARVFLRMNKGRFASSGLINISNLADLVITSLKPDIKATRVKEILREAIRDRKLTD